MVKQKKLQMNDISQNLNEIIFKYNIDKFYPEYRKMYEAQRILQEIICQLECKNMSAMFICGNKVEVNILRHLFWGRANVEIVLFDDNERLGANGISWHKFDKVYVTAFTTMDKIVSFLETREIVFEWIYKIFMDKGLLFQKEFFVFSHHYEEIQNLYEKGEIFTRKAWARVLQLELYYEKENIENCFFIALLMRNFACAEKIIKQIDVQVKDKENYLAAWNEIQTLLNEIRRRLAERQEKDIIIYWLDTLSYGDEYGMEYLCSRIEKSVCFSNAYTVTAYTLPTVKTMFCGIKQVDDFGYKMQRITDEDSELLRKISERGYDFKVISGYMEWQDDKYTSKEYHEMWDACSMICWDMLQNLLIEEKPVVLLVHLLDIHEGMSAKMTDVSFCNNWKGHYEWAKKEVDEGLEFYDGFISDKAVRFYLSDHGNSKAKFDKQHHVLLNILEKNRGAKKIESFFSYLDFAKLLELCLEEKEIDENELKREYVEVQDVYIYNSKTISDFLYHKVGFVDFWFLGYKGIINDKYYYVLSGTGEEWLIDKENFIEPELFKESPIKDKSVIKELRKCVGEYPEEILEDNQFQYSRIMYEIYIKQKNFWEKGLDNVRDFLCTLLEVFPDNSIAIRMGGRHSKILYNIMSAEAKKKVKCFIDSNPNCECSIWGLPVVTWEECFNEEVQGVILSSFIYQDMLREEAEGYRNMVNVIDLYQLLERNGIIKNEKEFYYELMPEEIWDTEWTGN